MKLRKGDKVQVLAGKDRGKQGEITRVITKTERVIVDGVNVVRKHQKPRTATEQGGIIEKDMPIAVSNVAILCSKCGATRIGVRFDENGSKIRICRKCGGDL
ncbi:MAG: 50S ribosomal protein L24 [Acidimicrobiaceae bacterium]|nr:50S ribosomal protein L24 [Acidimicrobiaceae bacterium]